MLDKFKEKKQHQQRKIIQITSMAGSGRTRRRKIKYV